MRLDFKIDYHDVVRLVQHDWQYSFAKVESSRKAIAERGWNPLAYNLLDNSELYMEQDDTAIKNAYQLAMIHGKETSCLNLEGGVARTMMDKIMEYKIRE
jgi:hypothetical protein